MRQFKRCAFLKSGSARTYWKRSFRSENGSARNGFISWGNLTSRFPVRRKRLPRALRAGASKVLPGRECRSTERMRRTRRNSYWRSPPIFLFFFQNTGVHWIKVSIDGIVRGIIAYSPYRLNIDALPAGKHTVSLELFGNPLQFLRLAS